MKVIKSQKGAVLLLVISMLTVLIVLSANFSLLISKSVNVSNAINSGIQAKYSAQSGIQYAFFALREPDKELRWEKDGEIYSLEMKNASVFVKIIPESSKIDINKSSQGLLAQLFMSTGVEEEEAKKIAANVRYWRSRKGGARPGALDIAEDSDYEAADLPLPGHRNFYTTDEISSVIGVSGSIYSKIKDIITVYGERRINALTASKRTLIAIGMEAEDIEILLQQRMEYYEEEKRMPNDIVGKYVNLTNSPRSRYIRLLSYAELPNGQFASEYAVVKTRQRKGRSIEILESGIIVGDNNSEYINDINGFKQSLLESSEEKSKKG